MAAGAAAVTGLATLGGALLGNKGNKDALNAQERARKEALDYEKAQDAKAEEAAKRREALYEREVNQWRQTQDSLLKRYGINRTSPRFSIGGPSGMPPGMPQGAPGMPPGMPGVGVGVQRLPASLKMLGMGPQQRMVNPYDLEGWDA